MSVTYSALSNKRKRRRLQLGTVQFLCSLLTTATPGSTQIADPSGHAHTAVSLRRHSSYVLRRQTAGVWKHPRCKLWADTAGVSTLFFTGCIGNVQECSGCKDDCIVLMFTFTGCVPTQFFLCIGINFSSFLRFLKSTVVTFLLTWRASDTINAMCFVLLPFVCNLACILGSASCCSNLTLGILIA